MFTLCLIRRDEAAPRRLRRRRPVGGEPREEFRHSLDAKSLYGFRIGMAVEPVYSVASFK